MEKPKTLDRTKNGEVISSVGVLYVFTGGSGVGKDTVVDKILERGIVTELKLNKVITCTDRPRRVGEKADSYHFKKPEELDLMANQGMLVEEITITGSSRKATSKAEIARLLMGENLLWRIDPSRAAEVATGDFFKRNFPNDAQVLSDHTVVICINAPKEVIESRRKKREGDKYDPKEFQLRDGQEAPHLNILLSKAVVIDNLDEGLQETVEKTVQLIRNHHAKNKKI